MNEKSVGYEQGAKLITKIIDDHCGTAAELARKIGAHCTNVCHWENGKYKVPVKHAITICALFNIQPHLLRPDIFPEDCVILFNVP